MSRKIIIIVVIAVLLVAAGVLYYLSSQKSTQSTNTSGEQTATGKDISQIKTDLGQRATGTPLDPLTDKTITATALKNKTAYKRILNTYGMLPEELVAMKTAYDKGDSAVFPPVKLQMSFTASKDVEGAFSTQAKLSTDLGLVPVYSYEGDFDQSYTTDLAKSFGLTGAKIAANSKGYLTGSQSGKTITVNPISGAFLYASGVKATATAPESTSATQTAQNFIINNPALAQYSQNLDQAEMMTYQRKNTPGITYVAFHRGWSPLPILNVRGATQTKKIGKTIRESVKNNLNTASKDPNITKTSDSTDGYARQDGFNTITVGIGADGIIGVWGNMRPLGQKALTTNLISAQEALANINAGEIYKPVISPVGKGQVDPKVLFPDGLAQADKASVTSVYLAYLEDQLSVKQNYLQPVYIFKGTATLKGGYEVTFALTTPAAKGQTQVSSLLEVTADVIDQGGSIQSDSTDSTANLGVGFVPVGSLPGEVINSTDQPTASSTYNLDLGITDSFGSGWGGFSTDDSGESTGSFCAC